MSKRTKRIEKLFKFGQFTGDELDTILVHDLKCSSRQRGTSHKAYSKPGHPTITIPQDRPFIKRGYIRQVIGIYEDELRAIESEGDDD